MKFLLNALLAIIILSAWLFGLYKTWIITLNTQNDSLLSGTVEGTITDMPIDEDIEESTKEIVDDSTGITQEAKNTVNYITTPYPETAEVGIFTELGKISANKTLYSYKVKLGGNIGGVENKWEEYSKWANISWKVLYISNNGNELTSNTTLNAWEIVYVELSTITDQEAQVPWTTTTSVWSNETVKTKPSQAKTCVKYTEFFECVLSKVSWVDPDIMRNNLNAFMNAISILSINDQEAKCTNLIYEIKSKSTSTANQACLELIK